MTAHSKADALRARFNSDVKTHMDAPWLSVALGEIGVAQCPEGQSNPRITEYHESTNIRGYDDKASWCSSFVNWCVAQVGIQGTGSALARSWLEWGQPMEEPVPGCVAVLYRDEPESWKGHVGFFLRSDSEHVYLLGGNQLGKVREHFYPLGSVLGYRWPASGSNSLLKPTRANCARLVGSALR